MTTAMLVALGKDDVKTMEDFAGSVPDDLIGYVERHEGESTFHPGALDGFGLTRAEAEAMIMDARIRAGWITEADLAADAEEAGEADDASAEAADAPPSVSA